MDEATVRKIREYREVLSELKQEGLRPLEEVGMRESATRWELELGEDLAREVRAGKHEHLAACDVLVLTANPVDLTQLDLESETKLIREECEAEDVKVPLAVVPRFGGVEEVGKWILKYRPKIVHFAGHGEADGTLWLEKADGSSAEVNGAAIAHLMKLQEWKLEAVFLNSCWSEYAAKPFREISQWVIGNRLAVGDLEAVKFARFFYRGLVSGKSVPDAFAWGRGELALDKDLEDVVKLMEGTGEGSR